MSNTDSIINPIRFNVVISREAFQSGNLSQQQQIDLITYFQAVFERNRSGEQFPYDLEELIPTVFTDKARAVDALKTNFMEGIDFIRSTDRSSGNQNPKITYKLSPPCFEYMVARKCRPVFEVYRKVFHHTAEQAQAQPAVIDLDALIQTLQELKAQRVQPTKH